MNQIDNTLRRKELRADLYTAMLYQAENWLFTGSFGSSCRQCGHFEEDHSSGQQCLVAVGDLNDWCFCRGIDDLMEGIIVNPRLIQVS
jgi:hypothetical protein